jgi:hypothetical protein
MGSYILSSQESLDLLTAVNRFNNSVIPKIHGQKYDHTMVIDGNDDRGIDVRYHD